MKLERICWAVDFTTRLAGLMGKTRWPAGYDGLYFPDCRSVHTFFTFLRPDLLFLDKNNKILRIHPTARPWLMFVGPSHTYGCLELPRGAASHRGLQEGMVVEIPFNYPRSQANVP